MISMNIGGNQGGRLLHLHCLGWEESTSGWRCFQKGAWSRNSWVFEKRSDLGNGEVWPREDVLLAHLVVYLWKILLRRDTCHDYRANQNLTTTYAPFFCLSEPAKEKLESRAVEGFLRALALMLVGRFINVDHFEVIWRVRCWLTAGVLVDPTSRNL